MLSTKGRYGLKAMIAIALRERQGPVLTEDIASERGIPRKYLEAILVSLRKGSLLRSVRGPGGGYVLAREPENISLLDILQVLEGPFEFSECSGDPGRCSRSEHCAARAVWQEMSDLLSNYARGRTLADLAAEERNKGGSS